MLFQLVAIIITISVFYKFFKKATRKSYQGIHYVTNSSCVNLCHWSTDWSDRFCFITYIKKEKLSSLLVLVVELEKHLLWSLLNKSSSTVCDLLDDLRLRLVLAARRVDRLEEVVKRCKSLGSEAIVIPTDVAKQADCKYVDWRSILTTRKLIEKTVQTFGQVDVLVLNAGIGCLLKADEFTEDFSELKSLLLLLPF